MEKIPTKAVALVNDKSFTQLSGEKRLSYNNLLDLDAAINIAYNTKSKENICTIIKHIPCGGAITKNQKESYTKALAGDPLSAFGGIIAFNQKLTSATAKQIVKKFCEVIAAPDFEKDAIDILQSKKKKLRVLKVKKFKNQTEQRSIFAGALIQDSNNKTSQIKSIFGTITLTKTN